MNLPGTTLLKVSSILYVIFAAISIGIGLFAIVVGGALAGAGNAAEQVIGAAVGAVTLVSGVVVILSSAFGLIVGILGIKFCARPDKAQTCFILGIILLVLSGLSLLSSLFGMFISGSASGLISSLIGCVLPVLYTVGAHKNKQTVPIS